MRMAPRAVLHEQERILEIFQLANEISKHLHKDASGTIQTPKLVEEEF